MPRRPDRDPDHTERDPLQSHVALLFTDAVLPGGMTGVDVAREARRLRPELPVLFTSGYAAEVIFREGRLDPGLEFISKPFDRKVLSRKLREALDRRR